MNFLSFTFQKVKYIFYNNTVQLKIILHLLIIFSYAIYSMETISLADNSTYSSEVNLTENSAQSENSNTQENLAESEARKNAITQRKIAYEKKMQEIMSIDVSKNMELLKKSITEGSGDTEKLIEEYEKEIDYKIDTDISVNNLTNQLAIIKLDSDISQLKRTIEDTGESSNQNTGESSNQNIEQPENKKTKK